MCARLAGVMRMDAGFRCWRPMRRTNVRRELVLAVARDPAALGPACEALRQSGFGVLSCSARALHGRIRELKPDLVVLHAGDRLDEAAESCRAIRRQGPTPAIVIGAPRMEPAAISMLDAGADDYVREPLGAIEFIARVRAVLRRTRAALAARGAISIGPLQLDETLHAVSVDQRTLALSPIEYRLLSYLARHPNRVVPYSDLVARGWGRPLAGSRDVLRVTMSRLRRKIGADRHRDLHLHVIPRRGYRLAIEATSIGQAN